MEKRAEERVDVGFALRENDDDDDVVVRDTQEWENRESYQPPGVKIEIRDDDAVGTGTRRTPSSSARRRKTTCDNNE